MKKCSLRGLEERPDLRFYTYPWKVAQPHLEHYVVLHLDAPALTIEDAAKGLFLIDSTWRYIEKMLASLKAPFEVRSLPSNFQTAYPRKQEDCIDPSRGLASVEALYLSYQILQRKTEGLLDHYHWKDQFLQC